MGHSRQRIGRAAGCSIRLSEADIAESSQIIRKRRIILPYFPNLRMYLITMWKLVCLITVSFGLQSVCLFVCLNDYKMQNI
jgi:hypothetical protein